MNDTHIYANGNQTTAVAAEMRAEIQRLTAERNRFADYSVDSFEKCNRLEAYIRTLCREVDELRQSRDDARERADRLSDLLARERLLRDLLLVEVRDMRATWRQE